MRKSFFSTSIYIAVIYSILFTFPMLYIPVAKADEKTDRQFTEDLLRCKGPTPANAPNNLPYLLKESGCIPDNVTAVAKLLFAIRLLDDDYMTKLRYGRTDLNFSQPSTEWPRAYALVRDVERLYQDDHERRLPAHAGTVQSLHHRR
ncbi:MAG: hypothetical protein K2X47_16890, partial [Bdellovibrionales bacterium]|nr:hypothetical protein [Bdellovibrionales bacterium]